jgi:hypothetical protein
MAIRRSGNGVAVREFQQVGTIGLQGVVGQSAFEFEVCEKILDRGCHVRVGFGHRPCAIEMTPTT